MSASHIDGAGLYRVMADVTLRKSMLAPSARQPVGRGKSGLSFFRPT